MFSIVNVLKQRPVEILLVEDDPGDAMLIVEILKISDIPLHLSFARDGYEAMTRLREGHFTRRSKPDLILLDLNMPKKDGREVLREIKEDPRYRGIPVLVMTGSVDQGDMITSYRGHADLFVQKPMNIDQFSIVEKYIERFWSRETA